MLVSSQNLDLSPIQWVVPQVANKFWELRAIHAKNHCIQQRTSTKTVPLSTLQVGNTDPQAFRIFQVIDHNLGKVQVIGFVWAICCGKDMVSHAVPNMIQAASPSTALCM